MAKEREGTLQVRDLDTLKVLADPLRLRILERLALEPATAKQVAERLELPPTRLYHHFAVLERVGLIELVERRPKRGTVEKYYRTTARRFRLDPGLLGPIASGDGASRDAGAALLEQTASELRATGEASGRGLLMSLQVRGDRRRVDGLLARLEALIEEADEDRSGSAGATDVAYRLLVAAFPLAE